MINTPQIFQEKATGDKNGEITHDTSQKVSSLLGSREDQRQNALNFFLDPINQGREISKTYLQQVFSCEYSDVRTLVQYVNSKITKGRILKKRKGGYEYHLKTSKKNSERPKRVNFSESVYNFLKGNKGVGFTKDQIIEKIGKKHPTSRFYIKPDFLQKHCKEGEVIGFFQSNNHQMHSYILGTQEEVDLWFNNMQGKKFLKGDKKLVDYIINNQGKEVTIQDLMIELGYKSPRGLLQSCTKIKKRFEIKVSLYSGDNSIKIPILSTLQEQGMTDYLTS